MAPYPKTKNKFAQDFLIAVLAICPYCLSILRLIYAIFLSSVINIAFCGEIYTNEYFNHFHMDRIIFDTDSAKQTIDDFYGQIRECRSMEWTINRVLYMITLGMIRFSILKAMSMNLMV